MLFLQGAEREDPAWNHGVDQTAEAQQVVWGYLLQENQQSQEARWDTHTHTQVWTYIRHPLIISRQTSAAFTKGILQYPLLSPSVCLFCIPPLLSAPPLIALFPLRFKKPHRRFDIAGDLWSSGPLWSCCQDGSHNFFRLFQPSRQRHITTQHLPY